jgi:hypothetical protein
MSGLRPFLVGIAAFAATALMIAAQAPHPFA